MIATGIPEFFCQFYEFHLPVDISNSETPFDGMGRD